MDKSLTIIGKFQGVECKEEFNGYKCNVGRTLLIVILGSICGLRTLSLIHEWASNQAVKAFLWETFDVWSVPCYSWFSKILKLIDPKSLNEHFVEWVKILLPESLKDLTIAMDGKTIRSTNKMKNCDQTLHIVNAHLAEWGITIGQKAVDSKSNEIPAMQELLKLLDIKGCVVVADALNCQTKTANDIVDSEADYLLSVKDNQATLKKDIENHIENNKNNVNMDVCSTEESNRGRIEIRIAFSTDDLSNIANISRWKNLASIGAINRLVFDREGKLASDEWHYYISSKHLTADELLKYSRNEWSVETMHWLLDVHFGEDFCHIEDIDVQKSLNIIRKTAINIIKNFVACSGIKKPVSKIMLNCLIDLDYLRTVLNIT